MNKERLPLVIGLSIPVLLVVVLAAIIYVPRLYVRPEFDFVYAAGSYPSYIDVATKTQTEYSVVNDRLVKVSAPALEPADRYYNREVTPPTFYRYSVKEKKNIPLTEEQALQMTVSPAQKSPDGFEVEYGRDNDSIFDAVFGGGRDYSERVLTKGSVSIPVNVVSASSSYYSSNFGFIGWIVGP